MKSRSALALAICLAAAAALFGCARQQQQGSSPTASQSDRACYIGTDNRAAGRQAGELVKASLPQGGKIMVFVGKADAQNARERFEGMKEALTGSNVEVIDLRTDDADRVRAKSNAA